jgi:hypothetical protein
LGDDRLTEDIKVVLGNATQDACGFDALFSDRLGKHASVLPLCCWAALCGFANDRQYLDMP